MLKFIFFCTMILISSNIAMADTSFCFNSTVTVGNVNTETAKNFRKLLRFEMQEFVEIMDEDGDCDYEAQGFIIQNGDQYRVGIRIMTDGVREKTIATEVDEESEISSAARTLAKKLSKWNEDSAETAGVTSSNTVQARIQSKLQGYTPANAGFELGVGTGAQRGLNLNIFEELREDSIYFRLDHGHFAIRMDYAESRYEAPTEAYQYELANRSIGLGSDFFAFTSGLSPYLGLSGALQWTNYPGMDPYSSAFESEEEFIPNHFAGFSASARLGLTILRLRSVPIRFSAETEYRMVPTGDGEENSGFGSAKLLLSRMPGEILGS